MNPERTVVVNGDKLVSARREKGFDTRASFFRFLSDKDIVISKDTLDRCETSSSESPHRAFVTTIETLAGILGRPFVEFVLATPSTVDGFRDCSGVWEVTGGDIEATDHFEYPNGPRRLTASVEIEVDESNRTFKARGNDHDNDPLKIIGEVFENGNHLVGTYRVMNQRLHAYGTLNLRFESCGKRICGFYLGRDTGHGTPFILGHLTATWVPEQNV